MDEQRENLIKSLSEKENIQQNRQVSKPPGLEAGNSGWNPNREAPKLHGAPPGLSDMSRLSEGSKSFK